MPRFSWFKQVSFPEYNGVRRELGTKLSNGLELSVRLARRSEVSS